MPLSPAFPDFASALPLVDVSGARHANANTNKNLLWNASNPNISNRSSSCVEEDPSVLEETIAIVLETSQRVTGHTIANNNNSNNNENNKNNHHHLGDNITTEDELHPDVCNEEISVYDLFSDHVSETFSTDTWYNSGQDVDGKNADVSQLSAVPNLTNTNAASVMHIASMHDKLLAESLIVPSPTHTQNSFMSINLFDDCLTSTSSSSSHRAMTPAFDYNNNIINERIYDLEGGGGTGEEDFIPICEVKSMIHDNINMKKKNLNTGIYNNNNNESTSFTVRRKSSPLKNTFLDPGIVQERSHSRQESRDISIGSEKDQVCK